MRAERTKNDFLSDVTGPQIRRELEFLIENIFARVCRLNDILETCIFKFSKESLENEAGKTTTMFLC